ncbi:hypothetical protein V6N13_073008 [Hibiscus sabdariffa]|uniref:D-lactate dehydrogenase (cytochrome) n=1 Tax=Hibiscus sabdariffa TaxID=183260 RepID=A0ABR2E7V7_9ROSI
MAFSHWLARLRSCSKKSAFSNAFCDYFYHNKFQFSTCPNNLPSTIAEKTRTRFFSWSSSLLPLAFAVSAGSLAFRSQNIQPSLCEPTNLDSRIATIGGKASTEFVVKGIHKQIPQELIDELKAICQDNMTLDYEERFYHGKPQNSFHKAVNIPDVVVFPRSEEEVSQIVKSCNKHKVPIVPYGGATSIEGHTLSPNGGVCIDMTLMKRVKALHIRDMDVVVEPGIGWMELNEYLEPYGLFFPLDPGPGATIGGMCATRCSGSLAVRYGTMRDNVISLKVVLSNGDIVKTASRARKSAAGYVVLLPMSFNHLTPVLFPARHVLIFLALSSILHVLKALGTFRSPRDISLNSWSPRDLVKKIISVDAHSGSELVTYNVDTWIMADDRVHVTHVEARLGCLILHPFLIQVFTKYDLTRLMIGSEGTLGVVTEITLRLQKIPEHSVVAMCNFPTIKDAADVAIATMLSGIQVSRVELLDEVQVRAVNIANGKNLPEVPTLMFEFIGTEAYSREQTGIVQRIVSEHNGSDFVFAEDPEAKKELWKIRKEALWACFAMEPNFEAMISDVCVPLSHLAELISRSKQELDASPLVCTVIAHAGDGNFHTVILFDPNQEEQRIEAERLNQFMVYTALSMEGTCTGEHGVGTGKMKYLEKELGIEALQTMKRIKTALDPNNIMNPGKLIPPHVCF